MTMASASEPARVTCAAELDRAEDECFVETLVERYDALCEQLRLPSRDCALYEAMFVAPLRTYRVHCRSADYHVVPPPRHVRRHMEFGPCVGALELVLAALATHAHRTVCVLRHIHRREAVVSRLMTCCDRYAAGDCAPDEAQEVFLQLLLEHQRCTVLVAEAITAWRRDLSRPWPFLYADGDNYLRRILEDCDALAHTALGQSFGTHSALRLAEAPCCSHLVLHRMLRRRQLLRRSRLVRSGLWQSDLEPALPRVAASALEPLTQARLRAAERVVCREVEVQRELVQELLRLAQTDDAFVTVLATAQLFRAGEGDSRASVPVSRAAWGELLNRDYCIALAKQNDPARVARDTAAMMTRSPLAQRDAPHTPSGWQFTSETWLTPPDGELSSESDAEDGDAAAAAKERRRHERVTERTLAELREELLAERTTDVTD